ncbi:MAG: pyridoxamine 5'-phosphate oxidase family protein [Proteobacteria bacterium]|nr:pyridoxamine 5'-phosphate oxidase family protein [Pseudomonadota bacterium]
MTHVDFRDHLLRTHDELDALFPPPAGNAVIKEIDRINAPYRALIEAAPFFALATSGPGGMDCTPRGDAPGFVRVHDDKTLLVPDRRGNNRVDSLRNIIDDPRVALLFLIPGCGETIRINGRAAICADAALARTFAVNDKTPRVVLVVTIDRVYYQCPKAIVRSRLWDVASWTDRATLPTSGRIIATITDGKAGGDAHDREYPARLAATLY